MFLESSRLPESSYAYKILKSFPPQLIIAIFISYFVRAWDRERCHDNKIPALFYFFGLFFRQICSHACDVTFFAASAAILTRFSLGSDNLKSLEKILTSCKRRSSWFLMLIHRRQQIRHQKFQVICTLKFFQEKTGASIRLSRCFFT